MSAKKAAKTTAPAPAEEDPKNREAKHHDCECSRWSYVVPGETEDIGSVELVDTGCTRSTTNRFAMGHDARLKSLLIEAGRRETEVRRDSEDGTARSMDWRKAADMFGFGYMVHDGVARFLAKNQ